MPTRLNQTPNKMNNNHTFMLPKINSLTGRYIEPTPSIHDQINTNYEKISAKYWASVKQKKKNPHVWENLYVSFILKTHK